MTAIPGDADVWYVFNDDRWSKDGHHGKWCRPEGLLWHVMLLAIMSVLAIFVDRAPENAGRRTAADLSAALTSDDL